MTWEVMNYVNDEIKFDEDDLGPGMTINFFNCEKLKVVVPCKIKNFMFQRCKRVEIDIVACVSMAEIIKSERVKVNVEK